jgi:hypothetical protein
LLSIVPSIVFGLGEGIGVNQRTSTLVLE